MNTIMLAHPKAGQHTSVKAIPGSRLSMDFVLEDVTVERHGEDLVFVFDDGSSLLIEDFYVDFTGENLPEFEVGGQIVSGADFFATMGPDLAPAAGPDATRSARYNEMGNADLAPGIAHLDGLDMSIPGSAVSAESQLAEPLMNLGAGSNSEPGDLLRHPLALPQARALWPMFARSCTMLAPTASIILWERPSFSKTPTVPC